MSANQTPETTIIATPGQPSNGGVSISLASLPVDILKKYASPRPLRRPPAKPPKQTPSEEKGE
jgi:hypothetical protein